MFSFSNVLQIFLVRKWWILLTMIVVVALALLGTQKIAPSYRSGTSLMFDFQQSSVLSSAGSNQRQLGSDYLRTQVDIMLSPRVVSKAYSLLEPVHQQQLIDEVRTGRNANRSADQLHEEAKAQLRASLDIAPSKDSRIIFANGRSTNPATAAAIANAVADAYIDVALELRIEPAMRHATWFNEQLADLRIRLEEEQQQLSEFQEETGIINLDERLDSESQRLQQLNARLLEAQALTVDTQSRQLGRRHPEYQRAKASEQAVIRSLEEQTEKVFSLKQERNKLALLRQDLDSSKATYNRALERMYDARLASQLNQTNVAILSRALAPESRGHNIRLIAVLALVLGLICGLAVALLFEMLDRRIHSDMDAAEALQLPVLGTV